MKASFIVLCSILCIQSCGILTMHYNTIQMNQSQIIPEVIFLSSCLVRDIQKTSLSLKYCIPNFPEVLLPRASFSAQPCCPPIGLREREHTRASSSPPWNHITIETHSVCIAQLCFQLWICLQPSKGLFYMLSKGPPFMHYIHRDICVFSFHPFHRLRFTIKAG